MPGDDADTLKRAAARAKVMTIHKGRLGQPEVDLTRSRSGGNGIMSADQLRPTDAELLAALKARLPELRQLLEEVSDHWIEEDGVYRFYHQSFKVYSLQASTKRIAEALSEAWPAAPLNEWFQLIIAEGTGRRFVHEHNQRWLSETRSIVEAFFHAKYFLTMICRYGEELDEPPRMLPSGWAAVLYLYGIR